MRLSGLTGFGVAVDPSVYQDVTPDPFDCPDLFGVDYTGNTVEATGTNATVEGVNSDFTVEYSALASPVQASSALLQYSKDNGSYTTLASWNGSSWTYTPTSRQFQLGDPVNPQTIKFRVNLTPNNGQVGSWTDTITLINKSDGDLQLDTFSVSLESNP